MFDQVIRELRRLQHGDKLSVPIPPDSDGYLDRECPSSECLFPFKVCVDDWRDKVRDEEVFCPFCGHAADAHQWATQQQITHAKSAAVAQLQTRIGGALKRDADQWNRRQPRNAFIRMTLQVNNRPQQISLPPAAAATMQLKIACPACACRYAVIGAAFFCPACGHNAADLMFNQSLSAIRNALDAIPDIRAAIPHRDTAETTSHLLIENGLQNAVTAFQRYAEALYGRFPQLPAPRRNAFQNLEEGSELWYLATSKHYDDYLQPQELTALMRFFQQRHLLAHTQGLVDDDYITRTNDTAYRSGQRLIIRESAVRDCLTIIDKLAQAMTIDAIADNETPI